MKCTPKILTGILVIALMVSAAAFAAPMAVVTFDSAEDVQSAAVEAAFDDKALELFGEGTEESPYIISTAYDYKYFASLVESNNAVFGAAYYQLSSNIDFSGSTFTPIGTKEAPFCGTLDGNGYKVSGFALPDTAYVGAVGYMTGGCIKNIHLDYGTMTARKNYSKIYRFGGIAGSLTPASGKNIVIEGCKASGSILVNNSNHTYFGGVVGEAVATSGNISVTNCVSDFDADIISSLAMFGGGFVAHAKAGSSYNYTFKNCVSYGDITTETTYVHGSAGAFVGYAKKDEGNWSGWAEEGEMYEDTVNHFENCFAFGNAKATAPANARYGKFIAEKNDDNVVISGCYANASQTLSGNLECSAGISTAKENLMDSEFLSSTLGFDFDNKWYMSKLEGKLEPRGVAKSLGGAVMQNETAIRLDSFSGVRFTSKIDVSKLDYVYEYGYIAARTSTLGTNELTLDFSPIAKGVAYNSNDNVDISWNKTDSVVTFTCVIHNIKKVDYASDYTVRPYIKYVLDGKDVIVYGSSVTANINEVALNVRNSELYDSLTDAQKTVLEEMLPTA